MNNIRMVDLQGQYLKIKDEIDNAIQNVIDSTSFINGPDVEAFSKNLAGYLDVKHVIPCGNGTDALQIALMSLDLNPGDEVITTTFSFIATAEVISLLGLTPVFVDIDPDTFNIDTKLIEKALTPKTKAIIPVHLFGQCTDMKSILEIARKHNLYVIEDNCQAIGADCYLKDNEKIKAGTIGNIGCSSFFPSKNLGTYGDGGAIFTNDSILAEKMKMISNHGSKVRYYHDIVGINSRLDSIQAAILNVKLKYLDDYIGNRLKVADFYDNAFSDVDELDCPKRSSFSSHVFHQYSLLVKNGRRNDLRDYLTGEGIPSMIYYPVPLHEQKPFKISKYICGDFSVSSSVSNSILSLPIHTEMNFDQLNFITETIRRFFE